MKDNTEIKSQETLLQGSWKMEGGKIVVDEVCQRIKKLVENYLRKVGVDKTGWEKLYQDPNDNRYWLLSYPNSEFHGGGTTELKMLTQTEVTQKFGLFK